MNMKKIGAGFGIAALALLPFVTFAAAPTSGEVAGTIDTYIGIYWEFVLAILGSLVLFAITNLVLFLGIYFVLRRLHLIH